MSAKIEQLDYFIMYGIPVIKICNNMFFDVLDSALIIGDEVDDVTDKMIREWEIFRKELFFGIIVCHTTKPHIPEALGFKRQIDDGVNYRFISKH